MFNQLISNERLSPVAQGADVNEKRCDCQGVGLIGDQPCPFHFQYETDQARARRLAREAEANKPFPVPF